MGEKISDICKKKGQNSESLTVNKSLPSLFERKQLARSSYTPTPFTLSLDNILYVNFTVTSTSVPI